MYPKLIFILMISSSSFLSAQNLLDKYIAEGLRNNLSLKQKTFSWQQSSSALKEARGMFMPSVNIEARYTRAGGGRKIEFPVGTMMNPVYQTLNQMLKSAGMPPRFPENIPNAYIPFLRDREHETKLRLIQPLFQPGLIYNYKIKRQLRKIKFLDRQMAARQLIAEIKTAYFNYLKTTEITNLLNQTRNLLQENMRVNKSLYKNDKVTRAAVERAAAELYSLEQQQAEADQNRNLALAYFNFLLNRQLDTSVERMAITEITANDLPQLTESEAAAFSHREELSQLKTAIAIAATGIDLSKSAFLPGISLVADYGFQGKDYSFTDKDDYWSASMLLSWNLFNGFQKHEKIQQAKLNQKGLATKLLELKNMIRLEIRRSIEGIKVAQKQIIAANRQKESAGEAFRIINRLYKEGMASQVEFLDARNTMTIAKVKAIIARYDYHIQNAVLEKVTAGWIFSNDTFSQK